MNSMVQIGDTSTPESRLATLIAEALGPRHPAMDDLAAILLRSKPAQQAEPQWCSCDPTRCEGVGRCRWQAMRYVPLAQQAEPVASNAYDMVDRFLRNNLCDDDYAEYSAALDSLYTAPPRREWVPLTDEGIKAIWNEVLIDGGVQALARAIEAALKEKNHG